MPNVSIGGPGDDENWSAPGFAEAADGIMKILAEAGRPVFKMDEILDDMPHMTVRRKKKKRSTSKEV